MTTLRKIWVGFWPSIWHILSVRFIIRLPRLPYIQHRRLKNAHVLPGILFLILLVAMLLSLPETAYTQPPYLYIQGRQDTNVAAGPDQVSPTLINQNPVIPVTGK